MAAIREAKATWQGALADGKGTVTAQSSGIFKDTPATWAARTEAPGGKTSPEELLAAAHASCFSMQLSGLLSKAGTPPTKLEVTCHVTFGPAQGGGFEVKSSALEVKGTVPGIDAQTFTRTAEEAKNVCPISKALEGNLELSVKATFA